PRPPPTSPSLSTIPLHWRAGDQVAVAVPGGDLTVVRRDPPVQHSGGFQRCLDRGGPRLADVVGEADQPPQRRTVPSRPAGRAPGVGRRRVVAFGGDPVAVGGD